MTRYAPIARTGFPFAGGPVAGSRTAWFDEVISHQRGTDPRRISLSACDEKIVERLSEMRAPVCGLSMDRPRIMGILNVTPDSFSDGGDHLAIEDAVARAREMSLTADILDIGGESTRPGAQEVAVAEEIRRTETVIRAIRADGIKTPISIDTRKARVAEAALDAGADMVNDVSAFVFDPELADVVAERDVPVCLMHAQGRPETMQDNPRYDDVLFDVMDHLEERITVAQRAGVKRDRIITDPGIGFGKVLEHNVTLLRALPLLHDLGLAVLLGASRKRFIGEISGADHAKDRVAGSIAVALMGAACGAQILRVHDTFETAQALALQSEILRQTQADAR